MQWSPPTRDHSQDVQFNAVCLLAGDSDLPAVRYAIKQFMEEQALSNLFKERWAASYDPARKVTYVSWFLGTITYFLDKLDFMTLVPPQARPEINVLR